MCSILCFVSKGVCFT